MYLIWSFALHAGALLLTLIIAHMYWMRNQSNKGPLFESYSSPIRGVDSSNHVRRNLVDIEDRKQYLNNELLDFGDVSLKVTDLVVNKWKAIGAAVNFTDLGDRNLCSVPWVCFEILDLLRLDVQPLKVGPLNLANDLIAVTLGVANRIARFSTEEVKIQKLLEEIKKANKIANLQNIYELKILVDNLFDLLSERAQIYLDALDDINVLWLLATSKSRTLFTIAGTATKTLFVSAFNSSASFTFAPVPSSINTLQKLIKANTLFSQGSANLCVRLPTNETCLDLLNYYRQLIDQFKPDPLRRSESETHFLSQSLWDYFRQHWFIK